MNKENHFNLNVKGYSKVITDYISAKTPDEAIDKLKENIRMVKAIPVSIKIERHTVGGLQSNQRTIQIILEGLHKGTRLGDIKNIYDVCTEYWIKFHSLADVDGNNISADPPHFFEKSFPSYAIIDLCLIGLLKSDIKCLRKHIYKCQLCNKYFISSKIDKNIKYCPGYCRKKSKMSTEERSKYDKGRRAIINRRKKIHKKKERIKEIMLMRNCSAEEAEKYYIQEQGLDLTTEEI